MMSPGRKTEAGEKERFRSTGALYPGIAKACAETNKPDFTIEGLRGRCAPKHRNNRRESAGWDRIDRKRCLFFVENVRAGRSLRDGHKPSQLPALSISAVVI